VATRRASNIPLESVLVGICGSWKVPRHLNISLLLQAQSAQPNGRRLLPKS
jgi:hypothetical protein